LWQKGTPEGKDLLFITTHDFKSDISKHMRCGRTEPAETFDLTLRGHKVNTVKLVWCRDFKGLR
ncbi:MAG: dolichyl-phosphate-mannose--protein mannosyltransferase, partial [Campylobacterales bacterium]